MRRKGIGLHGSFAANSLDSALLSATIIPALRSARPAPMSQMRAARYRVIPKRASPGRERAEKSRPFAGSVFGSIGGQMVSSWHGAEARALNPHPRLCWCWICQERRIARPVPMLGSGDLAKACRQTRCVLVAGIRAWEWKLIDRGASDTAVPIGR